MKVRNKLSRRAQVISAIAVVVVFGGGWLAVWKWPHLQFRYRMARLDSETRAEINRIAPIVALPTETPSDWRRYDFGFSSLALPGVVLRVKRDGELNIMIETDQCLFLVGGLGSSWGMSEMMEKEGNLPEMDSHGRSTQASLLGLTMEAYRAAERDFSWYMSETEVWSLERKLRLKAFGPEGPRGETRLFDTARLRGMIVYPPHDSSSHDGATIAESRRFVSVQAAPNGDGNVIGFFVIGADGHDIAPQVAASIQFSDQQLNWDRSALSRRIESLVSAWTSTTRPHQP